MAGKYAGAKNVILKVGSGFFVDEDDGVYTFKGRQMDALVDDIVAVGESRKLVVVTSGAIATAIGKYRLPVPDGLESEQQYAAAGQPALMHEYIRRFEKHGEVCAQLLLTRDDINDSVRSARVMGTIGGCLNRGWYPIVNENDTVATDEITFGDNDILAARLGCELPADLVVMMSNPVGLLGSGGGKSKEKAREMLGAKGIPLEIINGEYELPGWESKLKDLF